MATDNEDIYEPSFVAALFDEMSASYGITNYVSSFGFCQRWRRQTVEGVTLHPGMTVIDLMTGMGECWRFIRRGLNGAGRIVGVDFSPEMCRRAWYHRQTFPETSIEVLHGDALQTGLPDEVADRIVACFGLKTFSVRQLSRFGAEVSRLLKPGGAFSFVEIAVPSSRLLRVPYLFYLRYVIPVIGWLFLGSPENYKMLFRYTVHFAEGSEVAASLRSHGLRVVEEALFFGCARRITGTKTPRS